MSNILIVDDSPPIALLLQEMLGLIGHTAEVAHGGKDALSALKNGQPDLVLLDLMMPDLNGWQVYHELRRFTNVPVIFITASDTSANRNRAEALGEQLVSKEVTIMDLKMYIADAVGKREGTG